jgi:hypothetical protein
MKRAHVPCGSLQRARALNLNFMRPGHARDSMNSAPITLINVFTVDPANQEELVGLLSQATETSVRRASYRQSCTAVSTARK